MFIAIQTGSRCHDHDQVSDNIRFDALRGREIARSLNRLCHVQALYHVPKQVIQFFERLRVISRADEELAAVRIRASISHRHHTHRITAFYRLIIELITRSTNEGPHRVTRLDDDMRYDAVEGLTIIKMLLCQEHKIVNRVRCKLWIKLQYDQAAIRVDTRAVHFLRINDHVRNLLESMRDAVESCRPRRWRQIGELLDNLQARGRHHVGLRFGRYREWPYVIVIK